MGPHATDRTGIRSTVTVQLTPETEQKLRDQATREGQTLEAYLERLAEQVVGHGMATAHRENLAGPPKYISDPRPTQAEFERLLADLASGPSVPVLPGDFSRADIYDDHD